MKQIYTIKLLIAFTISIFIGFSVSGQSSDTVTVSGYIEDNQEFWDSTPHLLLSPESESTELPTEVDNSILMYFPQRINPETGELEREIYIQDGTGSCVAVSSVFYTFSYEINRVREVSGLPDENKYPPNFTWNFLNDGYDSVGSSFGSNFKILKGNGAANGVDWGNFDPHDTLRWMDGYEKYHNSHYNRIVSFFTISSLFHPDSLSILKHWIADHNEGAATGGLAVFGTSNACGDEANLPDSSAHPGELVIFNWNNGCDHAMTIVGYCDEILYDFNGDEQYTDTIDINQDGIIDVRDWEIGAFNVVGRGNASYGQYGFVWVPYKTMAEMQTNWGPYVHILDVKEDYEPVLEVKVKVKHDYRDFFGAKLAWTENADDYNFNNSYNQQAFIENFFYFDGGEFPLHGIDDDPIEISLDFSFWFIEENFGKIFYRPKQITNSAYNDTGLVEYMSIIDYRWGEEFELYSGQFNVPITTSYSNIFVDYDLIPHEIYIEEDLNLFSNMVSRFTPTVGNGATLTVEDGVQIDMYNSEIHILQGSSLIIEDNAVFVAKDGNCKLVVDGNISVGSNVSFLTENGAQLIVEINNTAIVLSINNAHFNGAALIAYNDDLTVTGSDFTDGGIYGFNGDFDISNTEFVSSFIKISNADADNRLVTISGYCNFSGLQSAPAIYIDSYPNFKIDNCYISECAGAINLFNCGYGKKYQQISNCDITGNSATGITVYNTSVDILHNEIANNSFGIKCFNRSKVHIEGDSHEVTQEIRDNDSYEVYASAGSFPHYFHWNLIQDDNLPGDPKVYYSGLEDGLNVRNNCWGENELNPEVDLYPYESYLWDPVWDCLYGSGTGTGSDAEGMYLAARDKIEAEDFAGAKADFQQIIVQYPASKYAQASLKELYTLEVFVTNDYTELKSYYNSEPNIVNNPELDKLADFLVNFCEIKLENWPTAIAWFENVIQNPESMEDSIFAIIDLGYTYFLMENGGLKSAYTGNMIEHKPVSFGQFEEKRDFLLSLLPGDQLSETMKENINSLKTGELLQNIPNPFNGTTQIWFKLEDESVVKLCVYDYTGKQISSYNPGTIEKGSHFIEFNSAGLSSGIYFYSLEINGVISDSKKMTILR